MSKTKTKSHELTLAGVDPRVRMKEVRSMVALAHKQNVRVDLMEFTGDDVARSQIALQDLLSKEQAKHSAARKHIIDRNEAISSIAEMTTFLAHQSLISKAKTSQVIQKLEEETKALSQERCRMVTLLQQRDEELEDAMVKLAAAMQTIKTMAEGTNLA